MHRGIKMKEIIPVEKIASKIHLIRNIKVMLDRDLAELYGVETKVLKQTVKRNIDRFPKDFMFEMTKNEFKNLRSQIVTSSWGGTRYLPMVFTEHGILMLSSVLNSKKAVQVNIQIVRVFTRLKRLLLDNAELRKELEDLKQLSDERFQIVFETLDQLLTKESKPKKKIGYTAKEKISKYGK
jgi:phage regulator Rha-like protein